MVEIRDISQIIGEYNDAYVKLGRNVTAYCPLSLAIYKNERGLTLYRDGSAFLPRRGDGWFMPLANKEYIQQFALAHKGEKMVCLTQGDLALLEREGLRTPDEDEYVYDRTEQNELQGPKFSKVRAKISRFTREHEVYSVPITRDNILVAYEILDKWSPASGEGDKEGAGAALDGFFTLGLSGTITYTDGAAVAYLCGGNISPDTYMLCSAKQTENYQGLNIKAKYDLYANLPAEIRLINTESDHGQAGVRMHKTDLRPVYKIETYSLVL